MKKKKPSKSMIPRMKNLQAFASWYVCFLTLTTVNATPWIAEVTPQSGAFTGGTELTIIGDGFSSHKHGLSENVDKNYGNWIYMQTYDQSFVFTCPIELTGSNTQKLVCHTPNFLETYLRNIFYLRSHFHAQIEV